MRVLVTALCALLLTGALWPAAAQSPLGELARQEEERRKTIKGGSRVYTNRDLPSVPSPVTDAQASSSAPAAAASDQGVAGADADTADAEDTTETPRDRAYWSGRLTALGETLARNQVYADALQSRINALTADFVNRDDPLQRAAIAADRDRAVAELERLKQQLVADEQAIKDLQDDARRAGVPAGWLR